MENSTGHVLKSDNVKMEGQFHLNIGQAAQSPANNNVATSSPAQAQLTQANIIENHPEFAIIEVTCRCGEKLHLRCEYANTNQ